MWPKNPNQPCLLCMESPEDLNDTFTSLFLGVWKWCFFRSMWRFISFGEPWVFVTICCWLVPLTKRQKTNMDDPKRRFACLPSSSCFEVWVKSKPYLGKTWVAQVLQSQLAPAPLLSAQVEHQLSTALGSVWEATCFIEIDKSTISLIRFSIPCTVHNCPSNIIKKPRKIGSCNELSTSAHVTNVIRCKHVHLLTFNYSTKERPTRVFACSGYSNRKHTQDSDCSLEVCQPFSWDKMR